MDELHLWSDSKNFREDGWKGEIVYPPRFIILDPLKLEEEKKGWMEHKEMDFYIDKIIFY